MSKSLTEILKTTFVYTYPSDGFDPINMRLNGKKIVVGDGRLRNYLFHPVTMLTSFLGLPNYRFLYERTPTVENILLNFVGWKPEVSTAKKVINGFKVLPIMAWHTINIIPKLLLNVVKLVTEFLPLALAKIVDEKRNDLAASIASQKQISKKSRRQSAKLFFSQVGFGIYSLGFYLLRTVHFIGRAVTSPINGMRGAYALGKNLFKKDKKTPLIGKVVGGALALLSLAITTVAYVFAFPIVAKYALAKTPVAIQHIAGQASHAVMSLIQKAPMHPLLTSSLVAGSSVVIGNAVDKGVEKVIDKWHTPLSPFELAEMGRKKAEAKKTNAKNQNPKTDLIITDSKPKNKPKPSAKPQPNPKPKNGVTKPKEATKPEIEVVKESKGEVKEIEVVKESKAEVKEIEINPSKKRKIPDVIEYQRMKAKEINDMFGVRHEMRAAHILSMFKKINKMETKISEEERARRKNLPKEELARISKKEKACLEKEKALAKTSYVTWRNKTIG